MTVSPRTILVLVVSRIGDTLLGTPALRALKETWPESRLVVMAHPGRTALLENLPWIDRLIPFRPWRRWAAWLPGAPRYDLAFVFHPNRVQLDYARRSARQVFAEATAGVAPSQRVSFVALPPEPLVAVEQRLRLVRAAGADSADLRLAYVVTPAERQRARQRLVACGVAAKSLCIALQLKSFPTKAHRDWPLESFAALIARIVERFPRAAFIVTGDEHSAAAAAELGQRFPGRVTSMTGQCGLRETAAILAEMDLYVGVDTGPTHLAGALGIPMVALYHAAYPGRYLAPRQHPRCRVDRASALGCGGCPTGIDGRNHGGRRCGRLWKPCWPTRTRGGKRHERNPGRAAAAYRPYRIVLRLGWAGDTHADRGEGHGGARAPCHPGGAAAGADRAGSRKNGADRGAAQYRAQEPRRAVADARCGCGASGAASTWSIPTARPIPGWWRWLPGCCPARRRSCARGTCRRRSTGARPASGSTSGRPAILP